MKAKLQVAIIILALGLVGAIAAHAQLYGPPTLLVPGQNYQVVANDNVPAGFTMLGIIQDATLDSAAANSGGTLTMNGVRMIVPANTVIQMPANTLTWAQLFDPNVSASVYETSIIPALPASTTATAPGAVYPANEVLAINHPALNGITGLPMTGLALTDTGALQPLVPSAPVAIPLGTFLGPFPSVNAIVYGNVDVKGTVTGIPGTYVVGLILPINQDLGNIGDGIITYIDYVKGRIEVNGVLGQPMATTGKGTVIELNDPTGRFGKAHSPDPRWSVDPDAPTVTSGNGYPMGIPKVPPANGVFGSGPTEIGDPDRPYYNRPLNPKNGPLHDPFVQVGAPFMAFFMPAVPAAGVDANGFPIAPANPQATGPDPWRQAPFMLGDYVSWAGILVKFNPNLPIVPYNPANLTISATNMPLNQQVYISANSLSSDKLAIYTAGISGSGGTNAVATLGPCYLSAPIGHSIMGTGGASITVNKNAALGIDGGIIPIIEPKLNAAVHGWCTDSTQIVDIYAHEISATGVVNDRLIGSVLPEPGFAAGKGNKGRFRFDIAKSQITQPVTRMYRVKSRHGTAFLAPQQPTNVVTNSPTGPVASTITLPGLLSGQYLFPQFGFQFADAPPGFPNVPNNFQAMPFLFSGEGGVISSGPLTPFPPSGLVFTP